MSKTAAEMCQYRVFISKGVTGSSATLVLEDGKEIKLPNLISVTVRHAVGELPIATLEVRGAFTKPASDNVQLLEVTDHDSADWRQFIASDKQP